jgi:hypothetical protein
MKKIILNSIIIITIVLNFSVSNAQIKTLTDIKISEPEFSDNIVYVDKIVGEGIQLEKQTISFSAKFNAGSLIPFVGIFSKTKGKNVVKGSSSPIKIKKDNKTYFVVKVSDNSTDPISRINIFKLKQLKEARTLETISSNILETKLNDINYLPFNGKKYGKSSYIIEVENLEVGEYAITLDRRDLFNMFNIIE